MCIKRNRRQISPISLWLGHQIKRNGWAQRCTKIDIGGRFWGKQMSGSHQGVLISTDLDGTLLDHRDYGFEGIADVIRALARRGIPVVFNTSKTIAECQKLAAQLGSRAPMIVENGAGILFQADDPQFDFSRHSSEERSDDWRLIRLGCDLGQLLAFKYAFCPETPDLVSSSVVEMEAATGLSGEALEAARARQFSLPMLLKGDEYPRIETKAFEFGFRIESGGRFKTLQGRHDKGTALDVVKRAFSQPEGSQLTLIGLGDAPNDQRMLEAADVAVVVKRGGAHQVQPQAAKVFRTESEAPQGWVEGVANAIAWLSRKHASPSSISVTNQYRTLRQRANWKDVNLSAKDLFKLGRS